MSPLWTTSLRRVGPLLGDSVRAGGSQPAAEAASVSGRWRTSITLRARSVSIRVGLRFIGLALTLLVTAVLVWGMLYLTPGSAIASLVNPRTATRATIHALEVRYHLNDSFITQYLSWLGRVIHGDFGQSITYHVSVRSIIDARLPTTLFLVIYAGFLALVGGIVVGTLSGLRPGKLDSITTAISSLFIGVPTFLLAIILITVFAIAIPLFPSLGAGNGFVSELWHLTLPAVSLAAGNGAYMARLARASVREESCREYVDTARSRGLPESVVVRRHVLRNALLPVVTTGGLVVIGLFAGAPIVETAFGLNGVGSLLIVSIQDKDFPVIQASVLVLVVAFVLVNASVDVLYSLVDPRLKARRR